MTIGIKKNAVALLYARYTVDINTTRKAADFSLFDALTTAKVAMYQPDDPKYVPDDPKYVVNTSRAESLWIHWPFKIKPNTATRLVPSTEGRMLHFRNWHYSDETGNSTDNYMHMNVKNSVLWRSVALNESFISTKSARQMGKRFEKDIFKRNFGLFRNLPKQLHYFDQITKCYDKIFYSNDKQVTDCPGPHHCSVSPVNGLNCVIAKRTFIGQHLAPNIVLYTSPNKGKFHFSNVGCSL
uniref:Glycosyltransferase family 92 protein n=1 Tax=Globodera pallida TaxID=36090 RepID=A0A183C0G1_GLOPA